LASNLQPKYGRQIVKSLVQIDLLEPAVSEPAFNSLDDSPWLAKSLGSDALVSLGTSAEEVPPSLGRSLEAPPSKGNSEELWAVLVWLIEASCCGFTESEVSPIEGSILVFSSPNGFESTVEEADGVDSGNSVIG